jgi:predicted TPR repeat methyltransferase
MKLSERAIELLLLDEDKSCLLLDIGCGSGLSGSVLEMKGHYWFGIDISPAMLSTIHYIVIIYYVLYKNEIYIKKNLQYK